MRPQLYTPAEIQSLSMDCALGIYTRRPSAIYAQGVAELLCGTAAHESGGFRYTRQDGFDYDFSDRGAWGLWQIEQISVRESLRQLARRPALAKRAGEWLVQDGRGCDILSFFESPVALCRTMTVSPRLCCLFARLHYLWRPGRIPCGLNGQALYWKQHYNTVAGAGTVSQYVQDWNVHIGGKENGH